MCHRRVAVVIIISHEYSIMELSEIMKLLYSYNL